MAARNAEEIAELAPLNAGSRWPLAWPGISPPRQARPDYDVALPAVPRANVHAHYEFRVDGKPRNPQTFNLAGAPPLQGRQPTLFKAQHADAIARLDDITNDAKTRMASAAGSH